MHKCIVVHKMAVQDCVRVPKRCTIQCFEVPGADVHLRWYLASRRGVVWDGGTAVPAEDTRTKPTKSVERRSKGRMDGGGVYSTRSRRIGLVRKGREKNRIG